MAGKNWSIEGRYVEYCSCDHGCPCESMADPTYGDCTGLVAFKIDKGFCESVPLDDLAVVGTFYFPRAIHHGQGVFQPIVDERANDAQREALFYIMSGEDQPIGTMFQIFSVIVETIKDPVFAKINFEWDLERRRAKIDVADVVRAHSEPIRNPVTDREHQMITVLPEGWVFHEAENASGFAKGVGAIKFDLFLMGLLFFGGIMNLYWIAGLALFVLIEKTIPMGQWVAWAAGAGLVGWGVVLFASAA